MGQTETISPSTNGNGTHAVTFPLDSFHDAAQHLRRPFTTAAVKFKVQATWPKEAPTGGLIVAYIDARLAVERLNLVVPHLWNDDYNAVGSGQMWCYLTVDGITRKDIGEGTGKGLVSDALKRAAVKFGVGVSLYAIPKMMLNKSDGHLKDVRTSKGPSLVLTDKGELRCRDLYARWLESHGNRAFGEPLDHGDVDGAAGDHEVDVPENVNPDTGEVTAPTGLSAPDIERIANIARRVLDADAITPAQFKTRLVAAGATDTTSVKQALATLTPEAAAKFAEGAQNGRRPRYLVELGLDHFA